MIKPALFPIDPELLHSWEVTPAEARSIQERLREKVETKDRIEAPLRLVAGIDVGFEDNGRLTRAAIVVLDADSLEVREQVLVRRPTTFPYIPGLLSFRELPAVIEALGQLQERPSVLLCDGQGIAHPRRLGIAAHLGVLLDIPSIGVAKSRLIGRYDEPPNRRGAWTPLVDGEERIGAVLRSRVNVKPLFVSIGHRLSLETAVEIVMRMVTRYRLPETTRQADRLASAPAHSRRRTRKMKHSD